jgi:hypothetical protein
LYEQLKTFVVDPFDDTPDIVIGRLIEIVNKAKSRWSPFEPAEAQQEEESERPKRPRAQQPEYEEEDSVVVL